MIELFIAFGAGLLSFLSPCVLPLIPGYISYISGSSLNELVEKKNIKSFLLVDVNPVGAEEEIAEKLAVDGADILFDVLNTCFLKYEFA